jgi:hypothetical protein
MIVDNSRESRSVVKCQCIVPIEARSIGAPKGAPMDTRSTCGRENQGSGRHRFAAGKGDSACLIHPLVRIVPNGRLEGVRCLFSELDLINSKIACLREASFVILSGAASVSDNADRRRVLSEELFAWAEMIFVLLERMILALRVQRKDDWRRREFVRTARKIESLFINLEGTFEIEDEGDLLFQEMTGHIDRLHELIMSTHAMIDRLSESES